jgi:hypothetical protein
MTRTSSPLCCVAAAELYGRVLRVNYALPAKVKGGDKGWSTQAVWADADDWCVDRGLHGACMDLGLPTCIAIHPTWGDDGCGGRVACCTTSTVRTPFERTWLAVLTRVYVRARARVWRDAAGTSEALRRPSWTSWRRGSERRRRGRRCRRR